MTKTQYAVGAIVGSAVGDALSEAVGGPRKTARGRTKLFVGVYHSTDHHYSTPPLPVRSNVIRATCFLGKTGASMAKLLGPGYVVGGSRISLDHNFGI